MTSSIHYATHSINKRISSHSSVHELAKFSYVIPAALIIGLNGLHPIELTRYPLQFLVLRICTDNFWVLTKVNRGISRITSVFASSSTQEVIELAKVANTGCLNYASSPPTATFNIYSSGVVGKWNRLIILTCLLSFIDTALCLRVTKKT